MDSVQHFLLTEVKAKNISMVEKVANFCLKPAQYLWNGKKIDFIQELDQKAVQIDFIYNSKENSWIKTALMVVLLIPGVLLGSALKVYATCRHHIAEDDVFIKKCLKKNVVSTIILTPRGQSEFGKKIQDFISAIQSTSNWNSHLTDTGKPLFLSEINHIRLLYEENHPSTLGWNKQYMPKAAEVNRNILNNIHLLWNLSYINLADHYAVSQPGIEVSALKEINPSMVSLQVEQLEFTTSVKAKDFFSN